MVSSNGVILHAHTTEHLLRMLPLMLAYPFSMHLRANLLLNKSPRRVNGLMKPPMISRLTKLLQ